MAAGVTEEVASQARTAACSAATSVRPKATAVTARSATAAAGPEQAASARPTTRGNERPQRTQEQQRVQQSAWQQHRSQRWDSDYRTWQQRGGYHGYRIPDERFRGRFGRDHGFRIYGLPFLVVGGYPRFQYNGYWFSMVDPWPEYWANDWYDTDEVYVVCVDNGYYLFNRSTAGIPTLELRSASRGSGSTR